MEITKSTKNTLVNFVFTKTRIRFGLSVSKHSRLYKIIPSKFWQFDFTKGNGRAMFTYLKFR